MYYDEDKTENFVRVTGDCERALDIGTGTEREQQKDRWPIEAEQYVTLDLSEYADPDIIGNSASLPFSSDSFDVVFLESVLEHMHVQEVIPSISEIRRVLEPDGVLAGWVPYCYPHHGSEEMRDDLRWTAPGVKNLLSGFENMMLEACGGPISIIIVNTPLSPIRSLRKYIEPLETHLRAYLPESHPESVSSVGFRFHAYN